MHHAQLLSSVIPGIVHPGGVSSSFMDTTDGSTHQDGTMVLEDEAKKGFVSVRFHEGVLFFMQRTVCIFASIWQNTEKEDEDQGRNPVGCQ
jgi:hypothetical protein